MGKASLRSDAAEKRAVYDEAIERFSDSMLGNASSLVLDMRLARLDVLEGEEEIAELKGILVDCLPYEDYSIKMKIPEVVERLAASLARQSGSSDREALRELLQSR